MKLRPLDPRRAKRQGRAVGAMSGERLKMGHDIALKGWVMLQRFRIMPGQEQFGQGDQLRARVAPGPPCLARQCRVPRQVADGRVQLPEGEAKTV